LLQYNALGGGGTDHYLYVWRHDYHAPFAVFGDVAVLPHRWRQIVTFETTDYYYSFHIETLDLGTLARPWVDLSATSKEGVNYANTGLSGNDWYDQVDYPHPVKGNLIGPDKTGTNSSYIDEFWDFGRLWSSFATTHDRGRAWYFDVDFTPGIRLPIKMPAPIWQGDGYAAPPGIRIGLGLGFPSLRLEYTGLLRLPDVYRLEVDGVTIPLGSIQCRRNVAGRTLTAVCPGASASLILSVLGKKGAPMRLYRGIRFVDGHTQEDLMMSVLLDSVRGDLGSNSGALTLTGSISETAVTQRTRTLQGVSYRNSRNGLRRVRCAVDTYLQPGDVAMLSESESLTVAELVYSITPSNAYMEVSE
jgi:hypothetical protein